jgi:hypothetical protein
MHQGGSNRPKMEPLDLADFFIEPIKRLIALS